MVTRFTSYWPTTGLSFQCKHSNDDVINIVINRNIITSTSTHAVLTYFHKDCGCCTYLTESSQNNRSFVQTEATSSPTCSFTSVLTTHYWVVVFNRELLASYKNPVDLVRCPARSFISSVFSSFTMASHLCCQVD